MNPIPLIFSASHQKTFFKKNTPEATLITMEDFHIAYVPIFLTCLITIFIMHAFFKSKPAANSNPPPTPFVIPIIGHLHLLARSRTPPHQAFHKISLKHGPVFHLFLGSVPCVVAGSPEIAKEFLKTYEHAYLNRPHNLALSYLTYGTKDFTFASYGPHWKFMKKIVMSQLLNRTTLDLLISVRNDEIDRFIKSLTEKTKGGQAVDLGGELVKMTSNVISRMIMSQRCSDKESDSTEMRKLVAEIAEVMGNFNLSDYIWFLKSLDLQGFMKRSKDIRRRFDEFIEKIMKQHEEDARKPETDQVKDFLHILLGSVNDSNLEIELSRENLKAFIMNIFTGGTDTSANTIEWAISELINHPNIMKKAVEEIDQVVGKNRLLQESDIPDLPYLQAIVKETLRLHPNVPMFPRQSTKDCTVAGYHIPSKTTVFVNVWAIGRDPNYWENPLEFIPERFEESQLDLRGQHFQMLPFGSGRRMCPGASLALDVVQTTLSTMIQCFEWKAGKDGNLSCVDMEEGVGLTLPRANPLVCVPVARLDPIPFSI